MDENADRTHVPGQQPVPERDIEPLWPTEQAGAHPWAPTAGPPPVPPQPGRPPSPADYPSLGTGAAAPGGWAMIGPPAGTSWSPTPEAGQGHPPAQTGPQWGAGSGFPPATGTYGAPTVPAPRSTAPVDLDMPFSLDQPAASGADPTAVHHPGPQAGGPLSPRHADGSSASGAGPVHEATTAVPVHQTDGEGTPDPHATVDPATGEPVAGADAPGDPVDGPAAHGGRVPTESPWAQPPQRPATAEPAPPWATSQAGALPV
ncbi:hypothetical protein AB0I76_25785, partial [Micromonospora sp. NPDC049799]